MEPSIDAGGAVIVDKLAYGLRVPFTEKYLVKWAEPSSADIVILSSPLGGYNNWVKRVIGVAGTHVALEDSLLYVNGYELECVPLNEVEGNAGLCLEKLGPFNYIVDWGLKGAREYPFTNFDVPRDHVFVLGDNRNYTYIPEPVAESSVLGKVNVIISSENALYVSVIFNVSVFFMYFFILSFVNRLFVKRN